MLVLLLLPSFLLVWTQDRHSHHLPPFLPPDASRCSKLFFSPFFLVYCMKKRKLNFLSLGHSGSIKDPQQATLHLPLAFLFARLLACSLACLGMARRPTAADCNSLLPLSLSRSLSLSFARVKEKGATLFPGTSRPPEIAWGCLATNGLTAADWKAPARKCNSNYRSTCPD